MRVDASANARVLPWLHRGRTRLLERLDATQADAIEQASQWCADAIASDGLVHLFGTGHSRIPVEEMFPRYGSYPGFNPIVELSMTFHTQVVGANGQRQAMFIERMPGLAEVILVELRVRTDRRDDGLLGRRPVRRAGRDGPWRPAARAARDRGDIGRAVDVRRTEPAGRQPAARRGRPGHRPVHAARRCDGRDRRARHAGRARLDIAAVAIVNAIKVRTAQLLVERGAMPPVITRASVVGAERSRQLFDDAYREHARRHRSCDHCHGGVSSMAFTRRRCGR